MGVVFVLGFFTNSVSPNEKSELIFRVILALINIVYNAGDMERPRWKLQITRGREGLESDIVKARSLTDYERQLGFTRGLLKDQIVLNFGCGGSNIGQELELLGISSQIVDVDLAFHPREGRNNKSGLRIQADGRKLPFPDATFETTLALFSTYQVPEDSKRQVLDELLRVSNTLHVSPVLKSEYHIMRALAAEHGFDILYSRHSRGKYVHKMYNQICISKPKDYISFCEGNNYEARVVEPRFDAPFVFSLGTSKKAYARSGNLVVMKRA